MAASKPNRARVGYLTVHPGTSLKEDRLRLRDIIDELCQEAKERVLQAGIELIGEPTAMVVECVAITLEDHRYHDEHTWGPSIGIFVEVHVVNPKTGEATYPKEEL